MTKKKANLLPPAQMSNNADTFLEFHSVRNAFGDNHLADYIQAADLDGAPSEPSRYIVQIQRRGREYKDHVCEQLGLPTNGHILKDQETRIRVPVDAILDGQRVLRLSGLELPAVPGTAYPVVIKNMRLDLRKTGAPYTLRETAQLKKIKLQLAFACNALGVTRAFVVGAEAAWGVVEFAGADRGYMQSMHRVAAWAHLVMTSHASLCADPPSCEELYPNMGVDSNNAKVEEIKRKLARKNNEMTLVRGIGVKERKIALGHGIVSWADPRLTAELVGITSPPKILITNAILDANRNRQVDVCTAVRPRACNIGDAFVDIETLGSICTDLPDFIFMIGVGFEEDDYVCIQAEDCSLESERRVLLQFTSLVSTRGAVRGLHWGSYEKVIFKKAEVRHGIHLLQLLEWVDMCSELEKSGYCPPGAFSYSLKSIVPAMHARGMIKTTWDSACTDGKTAMTDAWQAYRAGDLAALRDIESYNRVDVVSTMQIWRYLVSIGITM